jgi:prepilin-type N-terminal cleavage/methylation domain-containing protein
MMLKDPPIDCGERPARQREGGFSLIEVMAAAVIAAIILSAVYTGISDTFSLLTTTREDLRATQIIVSHLEGMHLEAWGNGTNQPSQIFNTSLVPTNFTDYFYPLGLNSTTNRGKVYTGSVAITTNVTMSPAASYSKSIALVTVTVSWTDSPFGGNVVHTRAMSTYIAQNGMQNYIYTH